MSTKRKINALICTGFLWLVQIQQSWAQATDSSAQDPVAATNDFSSKMLTIFKGPVVKVLAGMILFAGVAGLLRGRHQVAVSCGIAFILLLFLPIILQYFGG